ncbi:MAG: hypothetical protein HZB91_00295 [Elusimicrobia bacterium]|nr:hypothetical protein [Elusimicrobiota bacterium]
MKRGKAVWVDKQNGLLLHDPAPYPGLLAFEKNLNLLLTIGQVTAMYLKALQGQEGDLKFEYELQAEEDGWLKVGVTGSHVIGCDPSRVHISRFMASLKQAVNRSEALTAGSFMEEPYPFLIVSRQGLPGGDFTRFFYQQAMNFLSDFVVWPRFRGDPGAAVEYASGWKDGNDPLGLLDQEPLISSLIAKAAPADREKILTMLSQSTASAVKAKAGMLEKAWKSFDAIKPPKQEDAP